MSKDKSSPIRTRLKARRSTPSALSRGIRSDGLVLRVGNDGMDHANIIVLANRIVRQECGEGWIVTPMGNASRDFAVRRSADQLGMTTSQAFDLAHRLREHRDVEDCEAALVMPVIAPEEMYEDHTQMRSYATRTADVPFTASSSGSSNDDPNALPCTVAYDWAIKHCRFPEAWQLTTQAGGKSAGQGIVIGHPDTGYTKHPELDSARVLVARGRNFEDGNNNPLDSLTGRSSGHGTSTGSVIMSGLGTGAAISGGAPHAQLVPLRVTNDVVLLSFSKLAEAIRYAADDGHHVISISLGGPFGSRYLTRAVQYAIQRGVIIVAAAGNVWPFVVYPAKLPEVIAVTACNCRNQVWHNSASGAAVDISAPGESVWRALAKPTEYAIGRSSGTSYATALTASAAAVWLAHHGRNQLISQYGLAGLASIFKELLSRYGYDRPAGWDTANLGSGILNVEKLLLAPLPPSVSAAGMRALTAAAPPRIPSPSEQFQSLFVPEAREQVRVNLKSFLQADEANLNDKLNSVADEMMYYAVTDMQFRDSMSKASVGTSRNSSVSPRASLRHTRRPVIRPRGVSRYLKKML